MKESNIYESQIKNFQAELSQVRKYYEIFRICG